jgi:hypothetical protein
MLPNSDVEADVALGRCAPSGPRSLTPVVRRTTESFRIGIVAEPEASTASWRVMASGASPCLVTAVLGRFASRRRRSETADVGRSRQSCPGHRVVSSRDEGVVPPPALPYDEVPGAVMARGLAAQRGLWAWVPDTVLPLAQAVTACPRGSAARLQRQTIVPQPPAEFGEPIRSCLAVVSSKKRGSDCRRLAEIPTCPSQRSVVLLLDLACRLS